MQPWELKATDWGSFPRSALQEFAWANYRTLGWSWVVSACFECANALICCSASAKGIANLKIREHSELVHLPQRGFKWVSQLQQAGGFFNLRATGGYL
jgi:hypothetical protein